ncbi:MAG: polysaccharide lyase 6 family protein [Planctomycetales bacterium]|nr:polysaccharide lyase 6 family protein [Planctomycetales bacterium]
MSPRWRVGASVLWCAVLSLTAFCSPAVAKETLVRNVPEFDAAVKTAGPGDTIVLAAGEWRDADLVFRGEGTKETPIVVTAQTPGQVVLLGTSRLRIGGTHLVVRNLLWRDSSAKEDVVSFRYDSKNLASRCTLEECAIIGDVPDKERKFVSLYGDGNAVRGCRFEGKQSRGTLLVVWLHDGENFGHWVYGNFFGPRERLGKNGGEIIRIGDSATSHCDGSSLVSKNYFYRCDGEAEIISNKSCDNVYMENTFVGCSGALTLRHGNKCLVSWNHFFGDGRKGTGGVRVIGEDHDVSANVFVELTGDDTRSALSLMNGLVDSPANGYFQVRRAVVRHNWFVDCKETIVVGNADEDQSKQTLPPADCTFQENQVVVRDRPVFVVGTPPQNLQGEANRFAGGELGLGAAPGWTQVTRSDLKIEVECVDQSAREFTLPADTGPEWMKPGEEYLPEVVKKQKAKEGTSAVEKK